MPYCDNQGVRIHYQTEGTGGSGSPLVLLHGFGASLHDWYDAGYVAALEDEYRLLLVDARGHGASDKPHEADAYRAARRAADVVAVLDDLGVDRAHIFGYSMGAVTGFALAAHAPARCRSLIAGGASPGGYDPPETDPVIDLLRQGAQAWAEAAGRRATPASRARMRRIDPAALIAHRAAAAAEHRGFMAELLRVSEEVPLLLFAGAAASEHAAVALAAAQLARTNRTTFVSLPDATHAEGFDRTDLVLPHVARFLAMVSQDGAIPT